MTLYSRILAMCGLLLIGIAALASHSSSTAESSFQPRVTPEQTGCTPEQRQDALRTTQTQVLKAAPQELPSLEKAVAPGGPLAGWNLSHGYVALATAGAVGVDNLEARDPMPPLLLYAPSPASNPEDWLDFDGPDNPYRLVGWAYIAPYKPGSQPPHRRCIAPVEWLVHEAGWHLKDGGMQLTPGAATEPARPADLAIQMWHPQAWDIHFWKGKDGVPAVTFANPHAVGGGRELPHDAFFYLVDGRRKPPMVTRR